MSSIEPVTTEQAEDVRNIANKKNVGRAYFQRALDDGSFEEFLHSLKYETRVGDITAPQGCRIHLVKVKVKLDRPWQEAVEAAGPNTPKRRYVNGVHISEIADLYPPTGTEEIEIELILLNYMKNKGDWRGALKWARDTGLKNTLPREVFALSEQYPRLNEMLEVNSMCVMSTTECEIEEKSEACSVLWKDTTRKALFILVHNMGVGNSGGWFAFRK